MLQIAVFYRVKCKTDEKTSISQVLIDYRVNQWQKWSMTFEFWTCSGPWGQMASSLALLFLLWGENGPSIPACCYYTFPKDKGSIEHISRNNESSAGTLYPNPIFAIYLALWASLFPVCKMGILTHPASLKNQIALNKHMKRCSPSLIIKEMQIKTTVRCHLTLVRMAAIKMSKTINAGEGTEKREPCYTVGCNAN